MPNRLLVISYRFPPETYPLAIRVKYFLDHLRHNGWTIDAVTAATSDWAPEGIRVHQVTPRTPEALRTGLRRLRLDKLSRALLWPDPFLFWVPAALQKARSIIASTSPDAIAVFMMPYSQGIVGTYLKRETGLPLIFNLNDSPTCSDMNPTHPSRLHYWAAQRLEDWYVQTADAVIYVSRRNMERVRARQPASHRKKFHLIRRGAQPLPAPRPLPRPEAPFRIVYTGGTSGWYTFLEADEPLSLLKKIYHTWQKLGRHRAAHLDYRTHGPVYVGRAVKKVLQKRPEWRGKIQVDVYGQRYPESVTDAILHKFGLGDIVTLHGRVPHEEALQRMTEANLLFMALPDRVDGSPGGRISAKTYEYLMTDRPILAALPPGENRDYLQDRPGVHITPPDGVDEMAEIITNQAAVTFSGRSLTIDRSELQPHLSSTARATAFERILNDIVDAPPQMTPASSGDGSS